MTLSVAIITFNEEENIARTLRSVIDVADEIVIVDSGSTDRTVEVAQAFGPKVKIFPEPWKGFAAQKNSAIEKCSGDWILSLDADEELSPDLGNELRQTLPSLGDTPWVFWLKRRNMFLGRWIRRGGFYPDQKLRLFRRGFALFEERAVHETLKLHRADKDLELQLQGDLIHHAYPTLSGYIEHMDRYSSLGAQIVADRKPGARSFLWLLANALYRPYFTFLYNYIFRGGFLDGSEGLLQHLYHAVYVSWKYAKVWELSRKNNPRVTE